MDDDFNLRAERLSEQHRQRQSVPRRAAKRERFRLSRFSSILFFFLGASIGFFGVLLLIESGLFYRDVLSTEAIELFRNLYLIIASTSFVGGIIFAFLREYSVIKFYGAQMVGQFFAGLFFGVDGLA